MRRICKRTSLFRRCIQFALLAGVVLGLTGCWGIAISPDGRWLTFVAPSGARYGLMTMNLGTRRVTPIPDTFEANTPAYSPNGKFLAFLDREDRLIVQNLETGRRQKLAEVCANYVWSADSRTVLALCGFQSRPGGEVLWCDIAKNQVAWRQESEAFVFGQPLRAVALPGRDGIAYATDDAAFLVTRSEVRRLGYRVRYCGIGLAPDGRSLLLATGTDNPQKVLAKLSRYDLATNRMTPLPFPAKVRGINFGAGAPVEKVLDVTFSPDAKWLVTNIRRTGADVSYGSAAYSVKLDGTDAVELKNPGAWMAAESIWSPNGQMILWTMTVPSANGYGTAWITIETRSFEGKRAKVLFKNKMRTPGLPD